jgi:hypothetical protein
VSPGYSILAHQAIIDSMWDDDIVPTLLARFPGVSPEALRIAHAYAYGGSIIQDMGYYPFGRRLYSDLTHYSRSGEFVFALLADARDINEYAFAIGALSHYYADNTGHALATNPAVAILYPELRQRFGAVVTYANKPSAHVRTEFGFDVIQVARGNYAPQAFHDFVGFNVATPLLERAFEATYGLELRTVFKDLDMAVGTYRWTVKDVIPRLTRIAWERRKKDIAATAGTAVQYTMSRADYEKEWGTKYQRPGFFSKIGAFFLRIVPKIGPFKSLALKPSTPETEKLFSIAFDSTVAMYRLALTSLRGDSLKLEDRNLDTGRPAISGEYGLSDKAYADLLAALSRDKFSHVSPELQTNILGYFSDTTMNGRTGRGATAWRKTMAQLDSLRSIR